MSAGPPRDGPNAAKARFFAEIAAAFELLEIFYSLTREDQEELWNHALLLRATPPEKREEAAAALPGPELGKPKKHSQRK